MGTRKRHAQRLLNTLRKSDDPGELLRRDKYWRAGEPFFQLYLEHCEAVIFENPARGLEWARPAPAFAGCIESSGARLKELEVAAYAVLGGAYRAIGEFDRAESIYRMAIKLSRREGFSETGKASLFRRLAVLRLAQKRFSEAKDLVARSLAIYREGSPGARKGLARSLTVQGMAHLRAGEVAESVPWFAEALRTVDPKADPRTFQCAIHDTAVAVGLGCGAADSGKALRLVRIARRDLRDRHRTVPRAKLYWLEGLCLSKAQGPADLVETTLKRALTDLVEFRAAYEACLVALDLSALYLRERRWSELRALAAETLELATRLKVDTEALAALRLWAQAVEAEVVVEVEEKIRQARLLIDDQARRM